MNFNNRSTKDKLLIALNGFITLVCCYLIFKSFSDRNAFLYYMPLISINEFLTAYINRTNDRLYKRNMMWGATFYVLYLFWFIL